MLCQGKLNFKRPVLLFPKFLPAELVSRGAILLIREKTLFLGKKPPSEVPPNFSMAPPFLLLHLFILLPIYAYKIDVIDHLNQTLLGNRFIHILGFPYLLFVLDIIRLQVNTS